jgi:hypothetical protein
MVRLEEEPGTATVELDLASLRELRADVPILAEARTDFVIETLESQPGRAETDV